MRSWDFSTQGPLELRGEWMWSWNENPEQTQVYFLPQRWNEITRKSHGTGTFYLQVLLPAERDLGLSLSRCLTSYTLSHDSLPLFSLGTPGLSREEALPWRGPKIGSLPATSILNLKWTISNFWDVYGGPINAPVLGKLDDLYRSEWTRDFPAILLIGIILVMSFYHLIIWIGVKKETSSLYFSGICAAIGVRLFVTQFYGKLFESLASELLFEVQIKFEYLTLPVGSLLFLFYLTTYFQNRVSPALRRSVVVVGGSLSASILILPSWIFTQALLIYQLYVVFMGLLFCRVLFRAVVSRDLHGTLLTVGFLPLFVSILHDLITAGMPGYQLEIVPIGLSFFILFQSTILSLKFAKAFFRAEYLSANLTKEVAAKTKQIADQKDELERVHGEKMQFFLNLAHEIRTPLTLIRNYSEQAFKSLGRSKEREILQTNLDKLTHDISNFFDLEKFERGQFIFDHGQLVNLGSFLTKKADIFFQSAQEAGLQLNCVLGTEAWVFADTDALDRILNNLLENALRYTPRPGKITVHLEKADTGRVQFTVEDTGIGMTEAQMTELFVHYKQLSNLKRNIQGMGLGLCLVKAAVDDLKGEIKVSSHPGQGSRFTVVLKDEPAPVTTPKETKPNAPILARPPRMSLPKDDLSKEGAPLVLIIDDNRDILYMLHENLHRDFNLLIAENGAKALQKLAIHPLPDVILSDLMMDEMDGFELLQSLLHTPRTKGIPFIFMTARTEQDEKLKGLGLGAIDFLRKPFDIQELKEKIRSIREVTTHQQNRSREILKDRIISILDGKEGQAAPTWDPQRFQKWGVTPREEEIIHFVHLGLDDKSIAEKINLSHHTVNSHLKNIYRKCQVNNRIELLRLFF